MVGWNKNRPLITVIVVEKKTIMIEFKECLIDDLFLVEFYGEYLYFIFKQ